MNKNMTNDKYKEKKQLTKEIRQHKTNSIVCTLPHQIIKKMGWYNVKSVYLCVMMDNYLNVNIFLSRQTPNIVKGFIYLKKIKLQFSNTRIKSPTFNIPMFVMDYFKLHFSTEKKAIFFNNSPKVINDINYKDVIFLEFE